MPVTWTKTAAVHTNPMDGTMEAVWEVNSIKIDGVPALNEHLTFPQTTDDPTIQLKVEAYLAKRGYPVVDPTVPTLTGAKQKRSYDFKIETTAYVAKRYDAGQQSSLNALWSEGIEKGWVNRNALVQGVMNWVNSILTYFYTKLDEVGAATTIPEVEAITMDLAQFTPTAPTTTVRQVKDTTN